MRGNVITSVGNGCHKIGHLERGYQHLTLSDGKGTYGQSFPPFAAIIAGVEFLIGYIACHLIEYVTVGKFLTHTETHDIFTPLVVILFEYLVVFTITVFFECALESQPEIRITALFNGVEQSNRRTMVVRTLNRL